MLITRNLMSKIEKYFIEYFKKINLIENNNFFGTDYDKKMYFTIAKVINFYDRDIEKSLFIKECIIKQKSWLEVYEILHIERRTYFAWKEEILKDAVIYAALDGLIILNKTIFPNDKE